MFAIGLMLVIGIMISGGFSWVTNWVPWLILLFAPMMIFLASRSQWMAAGADWFASGTGWVKLYQLTTVELAGSGVSPRLYLTDTEGRAAHAELRQLQINPRLWDLVYNGILHSVHTREVKLNTWARAQVIDPDFPHDRRD